MNVPTKEDIEITMEFINQADAIGKIAGVSPSKIAEMLQRQTHFRLNTEMEERQMGAINKQLKR